MWAETRVEKEITSFLRAVMIHKQERGSLKGVSTTENPEEGRMEDLLQGPLVAFVCLLPVKKPLRVYHVF